MIELLGAKMSRLTQAHLQGRDVMNDEEAMKFYEKFVSQNCKRIPMTEVKRGQGKSFTQKFHKETLIIYLKKYKVFMFFFL